MRMTSGIEKGSKRNDIYWTIPGDDSELTDGATDPFLGMQSFTIDEDQQVGTSAPDAHLNDLVLLDPVGEWAEIPPVIRLRQSPEDQFAAIPTALEPFADGFDAAPWAPTLLQTINTVNPTPILGGLADIDDYEMHLDFRHGVFDIEGELLQAFSILTFMEQGASGPAGANHLHQTYSIEINVDRGSNKTLRMLAVWAEPEGGGLDPDDPIILNYAVSKSRGASERMSELCDGTLDIGPEPQ